MIINIITTKLQGKMRSLSLFSVATNMELMLQGKMICPDKWAYTYSVLID